MIRLEQDKLQSMYPQMSAAFSERIGRTIRQLPTAKEEKQVRKPSLRMILIAVVIILTMSTTAIALTRPAVLDWLLHTSPASPELESSAQNIYAEATADGITARITGVVYDGRQIALSYEIENSDPSQPVVMLLDSTITLNGAPVAIPHYQQDHDGRLVPSPHLDVLPVQRNPVRGGNWCSGLPEGLTGIVQGEATFIVCRPEKAFAYLIEPGSMLADTTLEDAELADVRATLESFTNTLMTVDDNPDVWTEQGYTVIGDVPCYEPTDPRSNLVETARIPVRFTFDADNAIVYDFSGASAQLADCTAEALMFRLSPLTTYIHVRLIPTENSEAAARALADKYGAFTLTDETGTPVEYSEMDYLSSPAPLTTCKDGQWFCYYMLDMPGLLHFPQSVGFTVSTGDLLRFDLTAPE